MTKLLGLIGGFKVHIIVGLAALAIGSAGGFGLAWKLQDANVAAVQHRFDDYKLEQAKVHAKAVNAVRTEEHKGAGITAAVGAKVEKAQAAIRIVTRDIIREVPVYVTPAADADCVVPVGFVRIVDAAAAGRPPGFPSGPGESPDAPSGIALSVVSGVVVENYGYTRGLEAQVAGWIDWYSQQKALADSSAAVAP